MKLMLLLGCVLLSLAMGSLPSRMHSAVYTSRPWNLQFDVKKVAVIDVAVPHSLGKGEVLVQVHASNINPVDHKIVEMAGLTWSYPHKLGFDLAGIVMAVGSGCARIKVGDEVWGEATSLLEAVSTGGTFAQYAVVSESVLGLKPRSLSMPEAGALPMVALTGYDALSWAAGGPRFSFSNATVLVLGGSGGTGHVGIQLAKAMGATRVITTSSSSHAQFVMSLGADQVIDYHKQNYYDVLAPKSVDVIYDCVGLAGTGDHALPILKEHGHFITLLQTGKPSISVRFHRPDVHVSAPLCIGSCSHYDRIDTIASFVNNGKLKVHIDATYSLSEIQQAFNHSLSGHSTGKVAISVMQDQPASSDSTSWKETDVVV